MNKKEELKVVLDEALENLDYLQKLNIRISIGVVLLIISMIAILIFQIQIPFVSIFMPFAYGWFFRRLHYSILDYELIVEELEEEIKSL